MSLPSAPSLPDPSNEPAGGLRHLVDELLSHYRDLRKHLGYQLRNPDDAADIAQTSFERVYASALRAGDASAPLIDSPRGLLFRVAHNLCIDLARQRKTAQAWLDERTALDSSLTAPSAEHVLAARQLAQRIVALLEQLPARRREVFILFRAYGYSRSEIATRLGITEAAVAKHLVRATVDCARVFSEFPLHDA
jgi:RNA polymerase sigma factor (sigma-70 family)